MFCNRENYENQIYYLRFSDCYRKPFCQPTFSRILICNFSKRLKCLEADVIVVGGGAAGCILMNQLSENGRYSVLGIEAGANLTSDPAIEAVGLPAFLLPGIAGVQVFLVGMEANQATTNAQWTSR